MIKMLLTVGFEEGVQKRCQRKTLKIAIRTSSCVAQDRNSRAYNMAGAFGYASCTLYFKKNRSWLKHLTVYAICQELV